MNEINVCNEDCAGCSSNNGENKMKDIDKEILDLITWVGEYKIRNSPYVFKIDGVTYSWSDLGSDQRFVEWRYGRWMRGFGGENFTDYVKSSLENGKILIKDYIAENYVLPPDCDSRTIGYLADKCTKTISFGGTWPQVLRFLDGEIEFFRTHPRKANGKRGDYE